MSRRIFSCLGQSLIPFSVAMLSSFCLFSEGYVSHQNRILYSSFIPFPNKRLQHVKNQVERVPDQFTPLWKWRVAEPGKSNNGLSEGERGSRVLSKVEMALRKCKFLLLLSCCLG